MVKRNMTVAQFLKEKNRRRESCKTLNMHDKKVVQFVPFSDAAVHPLGQNTPQIVDKSGTGSAVENNSIAPCRSSTFIGTCFCYM